MNKSNFNNFQKKFSEIDNLDNLPIKDIWDSESSWQKHKCNADRIARYYGDSDYDIHKDYANRMNLCSQFLDFQLITESDRNKLKLHGARFCRVRYCPVCQWRRSLKWKAKAFEVIPAIVRDYPTHRWLFLTLTVQNCKITELRSTLNWLNKSWQRLSQRKKFPAVGWLRSTEVTRSKNGLAHPHFHCILLVRASYYGREYIKQDDWVKLWKNSLKVDYDPILDIRAVKNNTDTLKLIPEVLKYCVKESDLFGDRKWFLELSNQMHKLRTVATGGIIKEYFHELEQNREWIADFDKEFPHLYFDWRYKTQKYKLSNHS